MPDQQNELREAGRVLSPIINQYCAIDALYHRGKDLIFRTSPFSRSPEWQSELSRRAFEAGFYLSYYRDNDSLLILSRDIRPRKKKIPWLNILLFVLAFISMILAYSYYLEYGPEIFRDISLMKSGLIFAISLMVILIFHEFGHYIAGRMHKADVSLPYFIPAPVLIGTLGAVIKSRSPFKNRRQLFDVGAAGPLAGILPAIVVLSIGFMKAEAIPIPEGFEDGFGFSIGHSLLYDFLRMLFISPAPEGHIIIINPYMFAGWVGLFVTMLNLMPVGQLDGGHIIYALFGKKIQTILAWLVLAAMVGLGFLWPGWFLWAFLAAVIIKLKHPPTLDDTAELGRTRKILGWIAIAVFVLTFMPVPIRIAMG